MSGVGGENAIGDIHAIYVGAASGDNGAISAPPGFRDEMEVDGDASLFVDGTTGELAV